MRKNFCLITGATSGIGKAAASVLAQKGFSLILTGRNSGKGRSYANDLVKKFPDISTEFIPADLSSMEEVKQLAAKISSGYERIDVLINNAGARFNDFVKSKDGIEMTFATNHLGHFLLTHLLMDLIKRSPSARIINVTSSVHSGCTNDFSDAAAPTNYDRKAAYCKSKLANLLFTYELADRLRNSKVSVNAVNPGGVLTNLGRNNGLIPWFRHIGYYLLKRELLSPSEGADTIVYMAEAPELEGITGKYFYKRKEIKSSPESYRKEDALKLWDLSIKLCELDNKI
jgi:NAD(P)-dependent dehydrogenase (short-subunit alcohol dehydrogenase family)